MRRKPSACQSTWVLLACANLVNSDDAPPPVCSVAVLAAAEYGDMVQLEDALKVETPACVDEKTWQTPLHRAAEAGQLDAAMRLLAVGALMDRDYWGRAPLHSAVDAGQTQMVALLLDSGAYIELTDDGLLTPLHHASRRGHIDTVRLLLDRGAKVDTLDNDGRSSLHYSCRGDEYLNVSKELVQRGANIERADIIGFRPLHVSCYQNQILTSQYLIGLNVDLYAMDRAGWNPLVHAAANSHVELAQWLVVETLRPRQFALPDPDKMWKPDMGAPVFLGMQAWLVALIIITCFVGLLAFPTIVIMKRFAELRKPYEVQLEDKELEEFVAEVFDMLDGHEDSTQAMCEEWDRVPAHTLQDLHRVKTGKPAQH